MSTNKIPKSQSDAYMNGWGARHRGLPLIVPHQFQGHEEGAAWLKGYDDCERGAIDAVYALGPELLTTEDETQRRD